MFPNRLHTHRRSFPSVLCRLPAEIPADFKKTVQQHRKTAGELRAGNSGAGSKHARRLRQNGLKDAALYGKII